MLSDYFGSGKAKLVLERSSHVLGQGTLDRVAGTLERSEVSAEKQAATSKMASVFLVSGSPLRRPRSQTSRRPRPRNPSHSAPRPRRQWRRCKWRDQPATGDRRRPGVCKPGKAPSDVEVGTACCRPRGDGAYTPFGLHLSQGSPSHGAANWLGNMAGRLFALALCGTLLPANRRFGTGVCDVILRADQ